MSENKEECGSDCGCDGSEHEDMSAEDINYQNNVILNTLIDFLIEKKVIDEDEFIKKLNDVEDEIQSDEEKEE